MIVARGDTRELGNKFSKPMYSAESILSASDFNGELISTRNLREPDMGTMQTYLQVNIYADTKWFLVSLWFMNYPTLKNMVSVKEETKAGV